jgi:hypothetical protein
MSDMGGLALPRPPPPSGNELFDPVGFYRMILGLSSCRVFLCLISESHQNGY